MGRGTMNISLIISIITFSLIFSTDELLSDHRLRGSGKMKGMMDSCDQSNGTSPGFCGCVSQCSSDCLDGHHKGGGESSLARGGCLLHCVLRKCLGGGGGQTNSSSSTSH